MIRLTCDVSGLLVILCDWFFFFKQKTAYERRISDWSSDVCSSDLGGEAAVAGDGAGDHPREHHAQDRRIPARKGNHADMARIAVIDAGKRGAGQPQPVRSKAGDRIAAHAEIRASDIGVAIATALRARTEPGGRENGRAEGGE